MIQVERETDLAVMDFFFYDFVVTTDARSGNPFIAPAQDGCILIVRFPPQAIAEGVYLFSDAAPGEPPASNNPTGLPFDPPPILSALSGPSQLAFVFDASTGDGIELATGTEADLLDWTGWKLSVPANAVNTVVPSGPLAYAFPEPPTNMSTYIEFPYAMYLSPTVWQQPADSFGFGYRTVFQNTSLTNTSNNVTDLFSCQMVAQPGLEIIQQGPGEPVVQIPDNEPLPFAVLWCDDLTAQGFGAYPIFDDPLEYDPDYDVTLWKFIEYGRPAT